MKYKITIPEPCHEDWSKMSPQEKGRFCDKCQKRVVDFTTHSTAQLYKEVASGNNLCGRFRADQLNRDLVDAPIKKGFSYKWALSSFITIFGVNHAFGQSEESFPLGKIAPVELTESSEASIEPPPHAADTIEIKGTLRDALTQEEIPFANIVCKELAIGCISDKDGDYTLKFPIAQLTEETKIVVSYIGYEDLEILIGKQKRSKFLNINLQVNPGLMGDICIVKATPWQRFTSWVKRVF